MPNMRSEMLKKFLADSQIGSQLVDLHVYIVPPDLWREQLQSANNTIVDDSVSAGFIRVLPETNVYTLREEIELQLGADALPADYVFLKAVGRHLTRLRPKQEFQLKVKNFLPPQSYAPEIYILEASAEVRASFSSGASSQRSQKSYEDPYRLESYRSPYGDKPEFNHKRPLPGINGFESPKSTIATQTGSKAQPTSHPSPRNPQQTPHPPHKQQQQHPQTNQQPYSNHAQPHQPHPPPHVNEPNSKQPYHPGQPHQRQPYHPGQPHPGQHGQLHPGQHGQPHPGQQQQGQPHPGQQQQQQQGQPHPGQQQQGQPHPGQPHQGQPHPGQQHPGQQHPGQQHPGQQHPGQPHPGPHQQGQPHPIVPPFDKPLVPEDDKQQHPVKSTPRAHFDESSRPSDHKQKPKSAKKAGMGEDERPVTSKMSQTSRAATPNKPPSRLDKYSQTRPPDSNNNNPPPDPLSSQSTADSGDAPLPPLSASPPNSPQPTTTRHPRGYSRNQHGAGDGEYLPPLSATPPHSPLPANSQPPAAATSTTHPRSSPRTDELDRQRLEEMMRRQREEEEQRRRELDELERRKRDLAEDEARRRREWEAEEEARRREEERRKWDDDRRRREQEEEEERRRREEEEEERRRREQEERFPSPPPPPVTPPLDRNQETAPNNQTQTEDYHSKQYRNGYETQRLKNGDNPHQQSGSNTYREDDPHQPSGSDTYREDDPKFHHNPGKFAAEIAASRSDLDPRNIAGPGRAISDGQGNGEVYGDGGKKDGNENGFRAESRKNTQYPKEPGDPNYPDEEDIGLNNKSRPKSRRKDGDDDADDDVQRKENGDEKNEEEQKKVEEEKEPEPEIPRKPVEEMNEGEKIAEANRARKGGTISNQKHASQSPQRARNKSKSPTRKGPYSPRKKQTSEEEQLLLELDKLRRERKTIERRREELVKRAKQLQAKTQSRRNAARDVWKKKYFDEKKKTPPLEEQTTKLKQELEQLHRKIMSSLEGSKDKDGRRIGAEPSEMGNLKIQATKYQHDIEDLQRRVENIKMKLTSEMKLRNQAETELRALRAELTQKKINVTLARTQQQQQALAPGLSSSYTPPLVTPRS